MGVATGCGCKEVYRFPHTTYPYSSLFYSSITTFFLCNTSSGEVLVTGAELLVDVEAVDVGLSMVGESMAITVSWVRFPSSGSWSRVLPSIHTARPVVLVTSSGEVLVTGAELLVDVEAVDVGLSMVGESMAITVSWVRFPSSGSWSRVLPSIHTARPVVLVIHHKPLQSSVSNTSSDMKVSV